MTNQLKKGTFVSHLNSEKGHQSPVRYKIGAQPLQASL